MDALLKLERACWSLGVVIAAWFCVNVVAVAFLVVTNDLTALGIVPTIAWFAAKIMAMAWLVVLLSAAVFVPPASVLWRWRICPLAGANLGACAILAIVILPKLGGSEIGFDQGLMLMAAGAITGGLTGVLATTTRSFVG